MDVFWKTLSYIATAIGGAIIGLVVGKVCKMLTPPNIRFRQVYDSARGTPSEAEVRWWHLEIENKKRRMGWPSSDALECLIRLEITPIEGGNSERVSGRWRSDTQKGLLSKTLRVGNPASQIPIAMRFNNIEQDAFITEEEMDDNSHHLS